MARRSAAAAGSCGALQLLLLQLLLLLTTSASHLSSVHRDQLGVLHISSAGDTMRIDIKRDTTAAGPRLQAVRPPRTQVYRNYETDTLHVDAAVHDNVMVDGADVAALARQVALIKSTPSAEAHGATPASHFEGTVDSCDTLSHLYGFRAIDGDLLIEACADLTALEALADLSEVTGDVMLKGNAGLSDVGFLLRLERVGGSLRLLGNPDLRQLANFSRLANIGGDLDISRNHQLAALGAFPQLQHIGGNLRVSRNTRLPALDALTTLRSIGGDYVRIYGNAALTVIPPSLVELAANKTHRLNIACPASLYTC